jgi:hypothetical protein
VQIFIASLTALLCYLSIIYTIDNDNLGGIIAPVFLCFLLAFWVASMFMEIFGMGIETILYCFIADEEMFTVENRFAEPDLVGTLHRAQKKHLEWKAKKKGAKEGKEDKAAEGGGAAPSSEVELAAGKGDAAAESAI